METQLLSQLQTTNLGCFLLPCEKCLTVSGLVENRLVGKKLFSSISPWQNAPK